MGQKGVCSNALGLEVGNGVSGIKSHGLKGLYCFTARTSYSMPGVWGEISLGTKVGYGMEKYHGREDPGQSLVAPPLFRLVHLLWAYQVGWGTSMDLEVRGTP